MSPSVPEMLHTPRMLLRPWRAEDAASLLPILQANQAHLGPWIPPRISEPSPLPELERRLAGFAAEFMADREWRYALLSPDESQIIGEVSLFPRDAAGRVPLLAADRAEIGYWVRADMTGRGLATEASRAMLDVGRTLARLLHAEIRCDARNAPSAAVPRRLGFTLATTLEEPASSPGGSVGQLQVWTHALGVV